MAFLTRGFGTAGLQSHERARFWGCKPLGGDWFLPAWKSTKAGGGLECGSWPGVWGRELVVSGVEGGVGGVQGQGDHAKLPALRCWVVGPGLG